MRRPPGWLVVVMIGALVGIVFAGVSTYDFVQHLDRQVHSLHCSFIPGMGHATGESGCQAAMMSPYSSVFRTHVWGGIPISLAAMAVFAFIGFFAVDLWVTKRADDRRATGFLALATTLPMATSLLMLTISLTKLGTTCKLCVCIYIASALVFAGAVGLWRRSMQVAGPEPGASNGFLGSMFGLGVVFVLAPVLLYLAMAPDHAKFIGTCENLAKVEDPYGVMVRVEKGAADAVPALEVLDPLCPACKAFEQRLHQSGMAERLDRRAILFPLDNSCNWMITETTHPGACTVSEAVLCAGDKAPEVIAWAFEVQDRIRAEAKNDPAAAAREVKARFPELASCVGSPEARSKLNKSLRWSVANNIRVLTPQLFIDNVKLCDEDVDLGLDFSLTRMLEMRAAGTLKGVVPTVVAPAPGAAPPVPPSDHASFGDKPATQDKPKAETEAAPGSGAAKPATEAGSGEPKPKAEAGSGESKPAAEKPATDKPATDKPVTSPTEIDKTDKPADKPAEKAPDKPADKPAAGSDTTGGAP